MKYEWLTSTDIKYLTIKGGNPLQYILNHLIINDHGEVAFCIKVCYINKKATLFKSVEDFTLWLKIQNSLFKMSNFLDND